MNLTRNISILGSGVVGTIIGKGFQALGNRVMFYDVNRERVLSLRTGGYFATQDMDHAIQSTDISFICVPTPTQPDGTMDLQYIKSVNQALGHALQQKNNYHLVVVKSTVLPLTTERVIIPLLEKHSKKEVGKHLGICVNPEFLTEIHGSWTDDAVFAQGFFNEPVIVIGASHDRARRELASLYSSLDREVVYTDYKTAEMIKYAVNCALANRISYWNEIFHICKQLGVDSEVIASTAAHDQRIGKYGTIHGKAFGGKCLPKDLTAFITFAQRVGYSPSLLIAVEEINKQMAKEYGVRE